MSGLFNKKILQQRIKNYTVENIEEKIGKIKIKEGSRKIG